MLAAAVYGAVWTLGMGKLTAASSGRTALMRCLGDCVYTFHFWGGMGATEFMGRHALLASDWSN